MNKKIAVVGTGANGSCISADLIRTGHDVTMIDQWPDHVETMRRDGLHISAPDEEVHVEVDAHHICDLCTLNRTFDIVLICMKAYDARWAAELIKPYLADDAIVVGIQNAMTADDIAEIVGPSRTIGCVVELASEMFEPGKVKRSITRAKTWFGIGALDPTMEARVPEIETILKNVGRVSLTEDIRSAKWMKLIVNSMSMGPQAMLGMNGTDAVKLPGVRDIMLKCGEEALRAGQSLGYRIVPVFGLSSSDIEGSNQLLEMLLDKMIKDVGTTSVDTVRQDHLKGRYSEVDLINGRAIEENAKRGEASPMNEMIVAITKRIHAGELKPDPSNLDLARTMLSE
jgi:2-dehydropantoate 2-reductase